MPNSELGTADLARYPFLDEAATMVKGLGLAYYDTPEGDSIIRMATHVIRVADIGSYENPTRVDESTSVKIFVTVTMLLKLAAVTRLTRRVSLSFAKKMEKQIIYDIRYEHNNNEVEQRFITILKEQFGLEVGYRQMLDDCKYCADEKSSSQRLAAKKGEQIMFAEMLAMRVVDFLTLAEYFRSDEWSLNNRKVHGGYVYLTSFEQVAKLIRSLIDKKFRDRIESMKLPPSNRLPNQLVLAAQSLSNDFIQRVTQKTMAPSGMPPCVKHCLKILENGENLPHSGRVFLASYLLAIGKSADEVVDVFKNAPDFKESTTKYQVGFLATERAGGRSYGVTGCEKLKGFGYCFPDSLCAGLINPMGYGRKK